MTPVVLALWCVVFAPPKAAPFAKWEKAISAIEARDKAKPPPVGAVLFCGSSSIVRWPLAKSFPGRKVVNRGFGGSQIADSTHFAGRIITPCKPSTIVFYAGDNDLASKKTPERVAADFRAFVSRIAKESPKTRIVFVAIKPSIARWKMWDKVKQANTLIKNECEKGSKLKFLDIATPMLGKDGKPRAELFAKDGLHLSAKGYALWSPLVEKALDAR